MRTAGTIERASQHDPARHDHIAWSGGGPVDLARLATRALATAPADERFVVVTRAETRREWDPAEQFAAEVASGRVQLADTDDAYRELVAGEAGYIDRLLADFDALIDRAIDDGYSGIRVIADNTSLLTASDAAYERWLAWEQLADGWETRRPVTGTCWFDRTRVPADRLARVATLHPLTHGVDAPALRTYYERSGAGAALVLDGAIDDFDVPQLRDALHAHAVSPLASAKGLRVDLSRTDYLHHNALLALVEYPGDVVLHNAPAIVRRMYESVPGLERLLVA